MTKTLSLIGASKGKPKKRTYDLTITSYTPGGESLTEAELAMRRIDNMPDVMAQSTGILHVYDRALEKMKCYRAPAAGGTITENWPDVLAGDNAAQTVDAASAGAGSAKVLALRTLAAETVTSFVNQPGVTGRNVTVTLKANGVGAVMGNLAITVTGTRKSATVTETFTVVAAGAFGADDIADTKFRRAIGAQLFDAITEVAVVQTSAPTNLQYSVGYGTVFALSGAITTESDIKAVRKDNAAIAAATFVGTAPDKLDLGADVADSVDVLVTLASVATGFLGTEVASGTNCGIVRITAEGI